MSEHRITGRKHPREEEDKEEEKVAEDNDTALKSCIVCLDTQEMTTNLISPHQCQQCKSNSWSICTKCEDSLFSKLCPICRTDYAPLKYYQFSPYPPPPEQAQEGQGDEQRNETDMKLRLYQNALNLTKISLIQYEKIGVWCPEASPPVIHFSLPQDLTVSPKEMKFLHVALPITDPNELQRLRDLSTNMEEPKFLFNNSVWDRLDAILEGGPEGPSSSREVSLTQDTAQPQNQQEEQQVEQEVVVEPVAVSPALAISVAATDAPTVAAVTIDEAEGEEGEEEEGNDEDCAQLLGIKETLQRIISLLSLDGSVFLTPLNPSEATDLIEAYVTSSASR
jgi:hypothetical protein